MTHTDFVYRPVTKPVYQQVQQNVQYRRSLRRAIWSKFVEWVYRTKLPTIGKVFGAVGTVLLFWSIWLFPSFALGVLTDVLEWNSYRIPIGLAVFALTLNARRVWRSAGRMLAWLRSRSAERQEAEGGNQFMFCGVPVDTLAGYLLKWRSFKVAEAMPRLRISRRAYDKIATTLEGQKVLVRDAHDGNARVLAPISYAELSRQLREDFPLAWDELNKAWVEKNGPYERFLKDKEGREKKEQEQIARKERRVERIERKIEQKKEELAELDQVAIIPDGVPSAFHQALALAREGE